jgi:dihydrofolate synthase / folylpolyglutamate synthase
VNYPDSVQFLYALGNEIKTAKFGLERIGAVLEALGRPQDRLRIVHVAGTNGKGSTCAMIEASLRASGASTGLFTSPHLAEPTERIRISGEPVSAERFAAAFDQVHKTVEDLLSKGVIEYHTTYFETVTAMAFLIFAEERVDWTVLEVGLGGRLDSTNVVEPELCVITPIDFDHERFLGRSIESIATEKGGIIKPGVPVVFSRQREEAGRVLRECAEKLQAPMIESSSWRLEKLELAREGSRFQVTEPRTGERLNIECPLAGFHQVENAVTAVTALRALGITGGQIEAGIAATRWPGRLEHVSGNPAFVLDGAHNPAGARSLAAYIERFYGGERVRLIYGAMRDKALAEIAGILFPRAAEVIVTAPHQARAVHPETLIGLTEHSSIRVAPHLEDALAIVRSEPGGPVFVTGSLFLIAEARALLSSPANIGAKR